MYNYDFNALPPQKIQATHEQFSLYLLALIGLVIRIVFGIIAYIESGRRLEEDKEKVELAQVFEKCDTMHIYVDCITWKGLL